jgi:hypothetical protein
MAPDKLPLKLPLNLYVANKMVLFEDDTTVTHGTFKSLHTVYIPTNSVARWFVFKPKIQIWVNFGGSCNGRCWYILWALGSFYGLLLYFMGIWYSSW